MEHVNVLVVVDTQYDFESGSLGTKEAQDTVPNIVNKIMECAGKGYLILDTMDTHTSDYLETNEGRHLPVVHTVAGTPGWKTCHSIRTVLNMHHAVDVLKDTFGSVDLPHVIRTLASHKAGEVIDPAGGDLKIVLVGYCTDICVITNALLLKTAFPEAEIVVDSKCCAGVTPKLHEAALDVMKSCQVTVE